MQRPNIVLLITHDTGRFVSPYGIREVSTPNCERLAAESVLFENSFATAPQCSPSRASIVTGRYPHSNGTMGLTHADFGWSLHADERPIARRLGEAGYQTWLVGLQHETQDPRTLGFDHPNVNVSLSEIPVHLGALLAERDPDRPFYCQLGCFETHRPFDYDGTPPDESRGVHVPNYLNDGPETRDELRALQGLVRRFDDGLGRLLDFLDANDLRENTILVVTTDHGVALPRAKGSLFDPGIETMLFARWAGRWTGGSRQEELVSHVDVLPTLLDAADVPFGAEVQGRSFLPLLDGSAPEPREAIFAEKTFHDCYDPMRCIRTSEFKYIRYFEKSSIHRVPGDIIGGGANRELGPLPREPLEVLYDLRSDPDETTDLATNPAYSRTLDDLRNRLKRWMEDTDDPILRGPVPSPSYWRSVAW